ncbi:MAG: DUF1566 domain-containing protein [Crocinitomicaceae bacterium]|nr:DUF1566 domain-containing protein [Crocinitomicaceae bacterium]
MEKLLHLGNSDIYIAIIINKLTKTIHPMKKMISFTTALSLVFAAWSQVEIDKSISLTGADGSRSITNLEAPVAGTDAVNKDYVDSAVAAGGGGGSVSMLSVESSSTMNLGNAARYCFNLVETVNAESYDDWHLPNADEMMRVFSGGEYVPSNSSANFFWLTNYDNTQRLNYYGSYGIIFRMSDGSYNSVGTTGSYYARCVR